MDFLDRLSEYIETNVVLNAPLNIGPLAINSSAISLIPTPSSVLNRYSNGGKTFEFSFQILIKDKNQSTTINVLNAITDVLDGLKNDAIKSNNDSFKFIKCEAYTLPSYVEKTEHDEYKYTALFTAELEKGGQ